MSNFIETTLMDGYAGGPHITEAQTGLANQGMFGPDDYVLAVGKQAAAEILTNNKIRIYDAVYVIQGRRDVIPFNGYEDVIIENGTQGAYRNDIIVRRYSKNAETGVENMSYAVIRGTADSSAGADPEFTTGNIANGDTLHEMPLYRVKLEGINIVALEPLFETLYTSEQIKKALISQATNIHLVYEYLLGKINVQVIEDNDHVYIDSEIFKVTKQRTVANKGTGEVSICFTGQMLQTVPVGTSFILGKLNRTDWIPEDSMVVPATVVPNLNKTGNVKAALYPGGHATYPGQIRGTALAQINESDLLYVKVNYYIDPEKIRAGESTGIPIEPGTDFLPITAT